MGFGPTVPHPGSMRTEKYTGNRRMAATAWLRPRGSSTQLVEIVVMPRRAKPAPPFDRLVAIGIGHALDGEQRRSGSDAQQRSAALIGRHRAQPFLRAHDADSELGLEQAV